MPTIVSNRKVQYRYNHRENYKRGEGGMGVVYKGWNEKTGQEVAIKMVHRELAKIESIRKRAKFEASLTIDHPNLVKMLGFSETGYYDDAVKKLYVISVFVKGTTIDQYVKTLDASNRVNAICEMMCSVLDALTRLHNNVDGNRAPCPIYHRDVKPANIMVEHGTNNVRLMDLGIAKIDNINAALTSGAIGTYPYASPEQLNMSFADGNRQIRVNATSDVYSLGVTFYKLLTGVNPFEGGSEAEIIKKQLTIPLPPHQNIPDALFAILLKATEKNQNNRYQTAVEFKQAIRDFMEAPAKTSKFSFPSRISFPSRLSLLSTSFSLSPELLIGISLAVVILIFFILIAIL